LKQRRFHHGREIAAEYLSIITRRSEPSSEITGEQLQVIRDNHTLVQQFAEMVKNQAEKETGERTSLAGLARSSCLLWIGTQNR
jgi:hypothetical protein